jgi:hypothetical protein
LELEFTNKPTFSQRIVASLPTRNQVIIGAAAVAVPVAYAYKHGHLDGIIKAGSNLFGTSKVKQG